MPRRALPVQGLGRTAGAVGIELAVRHLVAALRGELEIYRAKAVAIEALLDKLVNYNGSAEPVAASVSRRRRGRPPSDNPKSVKKRDAMRAYRARQKATPPTTKPARKRRRKTKAVARVADPVVANDHAYALSTTADSQADLREQIEKAGTIEAIIELLAAARTLADTAAEKSDRAQYRIGLELRARCERRGGVLLIAMAERGEKVATSKLGVTPVAPRWRDLARLSEEKFRQRLTWLAKRGLPTASELQRNDPRPIPPVETSLTEWETDENGCLSRRLVASGEPLVLEGEGHPA
jgi:hypothetical protein